jgi:molybdate transport system substrate-binding protein
LKRKTIKNTSIATVLLVALAGFFSLFAQKTPGQPAELTILVSDGVKPSVEALLPQIEKAIGQKVNTDFDSSKNLRDKILAGKSFDATILTSEIVDDLIKQGKVATGSNVEIARTGMGVGVRIGAAKPDISTTDALKKTLLNAKSIAFNPTGASASHIHDLLDHMGIAEQVKSKLILSSEPGQPQKDVAAGKAELVITLVPEIKFFPGVELVGPLPAEVQSYIDFAAGIAKNSQNPEAAKSFIKFIAGPAAVSTLRAKGMEPR